MSLLAKLLQADVLLLNDRLFDLHRGNKVLRDVIEQGVQGKPVNDSERVVFIRLSAEHTVAFTVDALRKAPFTPDNDTYQVEAVSREWGTIDRNILVSVSVSQLHPVTLPERVPT